MKMYAEAYQPPHQPARSQPWPYYPQPSAQQMYHPAMWCHQSMSNEPAWPSPHMSIHPNIYTHAPLDGFPVHSYDSRYYPTHVNVGQQQPNTAAQAFWTANLPGHLSHSTTSTTPGDYQMQSSYASFGAPTRQPSPGRFSKDASKAPWANYTQPLSPPSNSGNLSRSLPLSVERRGPPRKPKRSGHAIWVGNIPMYASIQALKDHFARDATSEIESVFLMSKSSCAFVNYRTKEACDAAIQRCNHSLFGPVRLLCRLRRDPEARNSHTEQHPSTPTDTDSGVDVDEPVDAAAEAMSSLSIETGEHEESTTDAKLPSSREFLSTTKSPHERFFILKSLTKEDLQESLQTGIWETQVHNEKLLDNAFRTASSVYLIFSVNKSGEYFGFARMTSSPLETTPTTPSQSNGIKQGFENLKITPTPATETAPRGHIVNDPARGILFWEAAETNGVVSSTPRASMSDEVKNKPFRIEWLSVKRVSFQRAKGMRNPWNGNKDVKVARDGTELETEVGKKIMRLFEENMEERR